MRKSTHTPEYRALCERLIAVRHKAGLSQRELAKKLRVSPSWVAKVEQGERRLDLVEFCWLCRACNSDPMAVAGTLMAAFRSSETEAGNG